MIFLIENPFNEFLKENALWIALSFAIVIVVVLFSIFLFGRQSKVQTKDQAFDVPSFLAALGGADNIFLLEARGSRLSVTLKEKNLLKEEDLKRNGVVSLIKMSNKIVLVVDGSAEKYRLRLSGS